MLLRRLAPCRVRAQDLSLFITFEGPEGCGKTTQMNLLAPFLRQQGFRVLTTREPGGTPIGEAIRAILLDPANTDMEPTSEFLLFSAARAQHVVQVIRPHLATGGIVLCDRFADSSLAYQGYGHRQDLKDLRLISRYATGGLVPDASLYLDIPVEVGLRRKLAGNGDAWDRMEQKEIAFHRRVRAGYVAMAAEQPDRWIVVDAAGDVNEVQDAIQQRIREHKGLEWSPEGRG